MGPKGTLGLCRGSIRVGNFRATPRSLVVRFLNAFESLFSEKSSISFY